MSETTGNREALDAAWARFCAEVERFSLVLADAADALTGADRAWEPTRWWRAIGADGQVWCESTDEDEVRSAARPTDAIEQLWREVPREEWQPA